MFYNPTSQKADIWGGISDIIKMYLQFMMIQKMYPKGASATTSPAKQTPPQMDTGGLDMATLMQMLSQMFPMGGGGMGQPGGAMPLMAGTEMGLRRF